MNEYPVSRRRFLKQASLGVAGLALTASSVRGPAADDSSADSSAVPEGKESEVFKPVRYRPMAAKVMGLTQNTISLNGAWRIDPMPGPDVREQPLEAANWDNFQVPGQWAQQGYAIPLDKTVALAREFAIPAEWDGYRIFLRFDAIHGGTHYWLNGEPLGYGENLFTPVEWEITDALKVGQTNRLDLEMKVNTASERLSHSSYYTGYSLGGIDRAVTIYALPRLHVSRLRLNAGLDRAYRDGELQMVLGFDNPGQRAGSGFALAIQLFDPGGKAVEHSNPKVLLDPLKPGMSTVSIESRVANPLKWNAEQPNLYKLILSLENDGRSLEQIKRHIGFRTVETRNRQLYVNGVRVKLAGVCHHEIDPLTGRADTMRHAEEDVKRFKSANLCDVRTSHYPCTREFLEAADRHGLYVEVEAPFCWVAPAKDLADLKAVLTATSAMIDYCHAHPSVIVWSLANESHWSGLFERSTQLCKELYPSRPTTFNQAFSEEAKVTCDIVNRHYPKMPYDPILKDDPRPLMIGECFFEVYHERTDVAIDPGLRELWAAGSADPNSAWGQACLENAKASGGLLPGIYPGAWSYIYASARCIGSEIWSGVDDIAFLPGGKIVSSENGNAYWGLVDGWRRPKPELELAKFVFAPVWFPLRQLEYKTGQAAARVPVENRYSFTDLSHFEFVWELDGVEGKAHLSVPPASKGEIEIPVRAGTPERSALLVRVMNGGNEIVNATLALGQRKPVPFSRPQAGAPKWSDDGRLITVEGTGFSLVLDKATGDFDAANSKHRAPIKTFPSLHVTRHDFGDLAAYQKEKRLLPYAVFPDARTRVVESVKAVDTCSGLELIVKDRYENFAGTVHWLIDKSGVGKIIYDYIYTGDDLDSREVGVKAMLPAEYDEIKWRRWSEWGIFPEDSICRTEGTARARRDKKWPEQPANVKPTWPWSQNQTELGTADFRSIKFHIYEASLEASDGSGVQVDANADVHFRACLAEKGVQMHVLSRCPLAPATLKNGAQLTGGFGIHLVPPRQPM
ncbi:MAG: twin-arginine translocation signal domain-containing protein [Verrucomicrobiota bacterium]|nr:twin-arginine translocation signal domain-containing protein [Verrucomicrobiota bacterium]